VDFPSTSSSTLVAVAAAARTMRLRSLRPRRCASPREPRSSIAFSPAKEDVMHTIIMRFIRLLALVATGFCCLPVNAAWQFTSVDFPGAVETNVFGINESGDAVGFAFDVLSPTQIHPFPFVYDSKKGTYTRLARAFGEEFGTFGIGINDRGVIVGSFLNELGSSAFVRSKKGVYTTFMHPGSVLFTDARGINERGLIAGSADDGDVTIGFIYDPASNTYVDFLPSPQTTAHGINNRGDVVGSVVLDAGVACAQCPEGVYGFLRTQRGVFTFFRVNGLNTSARGLTDSGLIAGYVETDTGIKSFVTRLQGLPYEAITIPEASLLEFPGMSFTIAEGINNRGDVVGVYLDADFAAHGFVAR
jgi:uncharacterized membrane protein